MAPKAVYGRPAKARDHMGLPFHVCRAGTVGDLIEVFLVSRLGFDEGMAIVNVNRWFIRKKTGKTLRKHSVPDDLAELEVVSYGKRFQKVYPLII